jgi:hypothetical protein
MLAGSYRSGVGFSVMRSLLAVSRQLAAVRV